MPKSATEQKKIQRSWCEGTNKKDVDTLLEWIFLKRFFFFSVSCFLCLKRREKDKKLYQDKKRRKSVGT